MNPFATNFRFAKTSCAGNSGGTKKQFGQNRPTNRNIVRVRNYTRFSNSDSKTVARDSAITSHDSKSTIQTRYILHDSPMVCPKRMGGLTPYSLSACHLHFVLRPLHFMIFFKGPRPTPLAPHDCQKLFP
jgi:hypothetical protein